MKKILKIDNFARAGLNSDALEWDLSPQFLTDIRNMRVDGNKLTNYRGYSLWEILLATASSAGHIVNVLTPLGGVWIICCQDRVIYFDGTVQSFIENDPDGIDSITNADVWTDCMLSSILILNNPNNYPQYWSPPSPGTDLQFLPWDATQTWQDRDMHCRIMRSHKQYLFALNLVDGVSGEEFPDGVRWSTPADVNGLPESWDHLDVTNVAGFTILGGGGGKIIDGLSLRDAFVVYREKSISIFDYEGGQYVWRIRHMSTTFGLIAQDCLVEVDGNHYFIGREDIYINDGNSITPLLHGKVSDRFKADFKSDFYYNSFVVRHDDENELWFCIPSYVNDSEYASIAFVHNWRDGTWTIIDLPESRLRHAAFGTYTAVGKTWDSYAINWDQEVQTWNQEENSVIQSRLVGVQGFDDNPNIFQPRNCLVLVDPVENFTAVPYFTGIERNGIVIDSVSKVTTVTRIYLNVEGTCPLYVYLGSQDYPGSPVRWKEPVLYRPAQDRKIDIRSTGELHCIKILTADNSSAEEWKISGIMFEYIEAGLR